MPTRCALRGALQVRTTCSKAHACQAMLPCRQLNSVPAHVARVGQAVAAVPLVGLGKLQAQLALAKAADVEQLAARAARQSGLQLPQEQGTGAAVSPTALPDATQQVVEGRILRAKAVRDRLLMVQLELQRVGAAGTARAATGAEPATALAGHKCKQPPGDKDDAQDDGVARGALAKLLSARGTQMSPGAARAAQASEDDSGASDSGSDELVLLSGSSGESEQEQQVSAASGSSDDARLSGNPSSADHTQRQPVTARPGKVPQQRRQQQLLKVPLKPKNRLGQRARRRMAARLHGSAAKHLQDDLQQPSRWAKGPAPTQQPSSPKAAATAALHPSWAAKQAQKHKLQISIASQATHKITFDDDSQPQQQPVIRSTSNKPTLSRPLHPSWEAKKRLQQERKQLLQPGTGSRITFDDE